MAIEDNFHATCTTHTQTHDPLKYTHTYTYTNPGILGLEPSPPPPPGGVSFRTTRIPACIPWVPLKRARETTPGSPPSSAGRESKTH